MTSADVVYTMDLLSDPRAAPRRCRRSAACSTRAARPRSTTSPSSSRCSRPTATSPTLSRGTTTTRSSSRTEATGRVREDVPGTGPFKLEKYTTQVGASFVRNEELLGRGQPALPDRVEFTFYEDEPPQILALQGGTVDCVGQISVSGGRALLNDPAYPSSTCPRRRTARCICETTRRRSPTSACARPWRCAWIARASSRRCSPARPRSATTARSHPSIRPPTPRCRSARRTSRRPSSSCPTPTWRTGSRSR